MPVRSPRICGCGHKVAAGAACPCERRRAADRKAKAEANRPTSRQRGYDSKWDKERAAYLKQHPRCARPGCGAPATLVDHIIPHRGNRKLFWSRSNWQPLCGPCHNRHKQSGEKRGLSAAASARVNPTLARPRIPVVIVCGAPGSGKSTYVEQHKGPHDIVIDLDVIRARLAGTGVHQANPAWTARALEERNRMLDSLAVDFVHDRAWFIVAAPEAAERERWREKLGACDVVLMPTPLDECLRRIRADTRRAGQHERMERLAVEWFAKAGAIESKGPTP